MLERSPECRYYILRRHMLNALCRAPGRESLLQQSLIYSPMRSTHTSVAALFHLLTGCAPAAIATCFLPSSRQGLQRQY